MSQHDLYDKLHTAHMPSSGTAFWIPSLARHLLAWGEGAPSDTAVVAMVYFRTDATTGDNVLYTWDTTGSTWDAMTA